MLYSSYCTTLLFVICHFLSLCIFHLKFSNHLIIYIYIYNVLQNQPTLLLCSWHEVFFIFPNCIGLPGRDCPRPLLSLRCVLPASSTVLFWLSKSFLPFFAIPLSSLRVQGEFIPIIFVEIIYIEMQCSEFAFL